MGILSDRCELNRQIKADNRILRKQKQEVEKLLQEIKETIPSLATTLETLRGYMVLLQYQLLLNREKYEEFTYQKQLLTDVLEEYDKLNKTIYSKMTERNSLLKEKMWHTFVSCK